MTPATIMGTIATVAVAYVSDTAIKSHFEAETQTKIVHQQTTKEIAMSEQETQRMRIFADALTKYPEVNSINGEAQRARIEMLKGVSTADSMEINGIKILKEDAITIAKKPRETTRDIQLNGNYKILNVDTSRDDEVRIKIKSMEGDREFIAKFQDQSLNQDQIKLLQDAEWKRSKVYLSVNATELRGEITTASIISVTKQPNTK